MRFSEMNVLGEEATELLHEYWAENKISIIANGYQTILLPGKLSYEKTIIVHCKYAKAFWVIYLENSKIKSMVKTPDFKTEIEKIDYVGNSL
jgi:hypothetical protein